MSKRKCGRCGRDPAEGHAQINDSWYCHGDGPSPTCYEQGVALLAEVERDFERRLDEKLLAQPSPTGEFLEAIKRRGDRGVMDQIIQTWDGLEDT